MVISGWGNGKCVKNMQNSGHTRCLGVLGTGKKIHNFTGSALSGFIYTAHKKICTLNSSRDQNYHLWNFLSLVEIMNTQMFLKDALLV